MHRGFLSFKQQKQSRFIAFLICQFNLLYFFSFFILLLHANIRNSTHIMFLQLLFKVPCVCVYSRKGLRFFCILLLRFFLPFSYTHLSLPFHLFISTSSFQQKVVFVSIFYMKFFWDFPVGNGDGSEIPRKSPKLDFGKFEPSLNPVFLDYIK